MNVLDCPMGENDADAATVREYLVALLEQLWQEGEAFSGKRPFGNSGWETDIYLALVYEGLVSGFIDDDGWLERCDEAQANQLISEAIRSLR